MSFAHPPDSADEVERLFERGVTDGLPVVPPTRERVERMLAASARPREELVALVPPNFGRATVEKLAVNSVMAGCRPDYFPVVLAMVEAACDPAFNLHGHSGTTNAASPLVIVNGPVRERIGLNCGIGVFGPGFRANATIGRALRLVMINLGGAKPGAPSMSTMGHPGRYTYCIGEYEEVSPWEPLHVEHGFAPGDSTVTLFAGEGPLMINDHSSREAPQLAASIGWSAAGVWNHKSFPLYGHTLFVIGPEHAGTLGAAGWSKADLKRSFFDTIRRPVRDLAPGPDGAEVGRLKESLAGRPPDELVPKFPSVDEIVVVVAGGTAGRFSAVVPGWMGGEMGSRPVTRPIVS
ncbi:MAG TPA: hypothetical protein VML54_17665 [Candidatus Limnocylindrales bacterium]|nr:hypothetical protein [Candidatus Limnocylindrales bacterium]